MNRLLSDSTAVRAPLGRYCHSLTIVTSIPLGEAIEVLRHKESVVTLTLSNIQVAERIQQLLVVETFQEVVPTEKDGQSHEQNSSQQQQYLDGAI